MKYSVHRMTQEDIKQVQEVAKKSWNSTYEGIIPMEIKERFLDTAYNDEMMLRRYKKSIVLVAKHDGIVLGFANFSTVSNDGKSELAAIYLLPQYQRKGIGSSLLQEGISILDGVKEVFINVEKENNLGRKFYEAKGFTIVNEFDDNFDGHILKTVRMTLKVRA